MAGKDKLDFTKAPALPFAPVQYDRPYHDGLNNILRQYFNTVDNLTGQLLGASGGRYLQMPYGSFQSSVTQTTTANTPVAFTFDTIDAQNDVSVVSNSRVTVAHPGVYNMQFSAQAQNTDTQDQDVSTWLRINGADLPGSNGLVAVPSKHGSVNGHAIYGWNYVVPLQADDYLELVWAPDSTLVTIPAYPAQSSPYVRPATASIIITLTFVSRL